MKTYQDLTHDFLYDEYIKKQKSIREIAKETKLTKKQIQRSIKKFKIKSRTEKSKKNIEYKDINILTKDFLYNKYIIEDKSIKDIAMEIKISSKNISKALELHGIKKRNNSRKGRKNKHPFKYKQDIKIGHNYGLLTVIDITDNQLTCKCECGKIKTLHASRIRNKQVKSCGCLNYRTGVQNPRSKGYGSIPHSVYTKCKANGSDRNIDFNLTIEDLDFQYKKQDGKCSISGIEIGFNNVKKKNKILSTASLDRIDSSKPYVKDNIQWVHKVVNNMKWNFDQNEFIEWCHVISNHQRDQRVDI